MSRSGCRASAWTTSMRCRCDPKAVMCTGPTFPRSTVPEPSYIISSRTTGGATKSGIRRAANSRSKSTRFRNRSAGGPRGMRPPTVRVPWPGTPRASKGFFVGSKVVQKIFSLDGTTAVAIAGAMSDAEYLVNLAKAERRLLALRRGYPVSVKESAKLISNIVYSSMKSYNPFYVELVVAGVDHEGPHVYTSDMSGAITSEDFMSSGSGSPIAYGVLEQGFRKEFSLDEARKLAEAAVRAAMERDPGSGNGVDVLAIPNGHALEVN